MVPPVALVERDAPPAPDATSPPPAPVRRPSLWSQLAVIVWLCWLYDRINNLSAVRQSTALAHAASVWRFERRFHIAPEHWLNHALGAHHWVGLVVSDYYDLAHFGVTLALVWWLWWRRPSVYRPLRNALVLVNVIGFVVFWRYPLAPPRMLSSAHFVDLVAATHALGSWHSGALASQANEFAAMPSLHVAWAAWCTLGIWRATRRPAVRAAGVAYLVVTSWAVLATANHFFVDVLAGLATTAVAVLVAVTLHRAGLLALPRPLRRRPEPAAPSTPPVRSSSPG